MKVAFLDRDGTLVDEPPDGHVRIEKLRILPGVIETLQTLIDRQYILLMVSNQSEGGTQEWREEEFAKSQAMLDAKLLKDGIRFNHVFMCAHSVEDNCACRKPKVGMVHKFLRNNSIVLSESFMVGDRDTDGLFAKNIDVKFYKMQPNGTFPSVEELMLLTA